MGSEASRIAGEYAAHAGFPSKLQKRVAKHFSRAAKGDVGLLSALHAGDRTDGGRNEVAVLSRLPDRVRREAYRLLYEHCLRGCVLAQIRTRCAGVGVGEFEEFSLDIVERCERVLLPPAARLRVPEDGALVFVRAGTLVVASTHRVSAGEQLELGLLDRRSGSSNHAAFAADAAVHAAEQALLGVVSLRNVREVANRYPHLLLALDLLAQEVTARREFREAQQEREQAEQAASRQAASQQEQSRLLVAAVCAGDQEGMLSALASGANVDAQATGTGHTALYEVTRARNERLLRALIAKRADPNVRTSGASTPLHMACQLGWREGVRILCNAGADPYAQDVNGVTPLHVAAGLDHTVALEELLQSMIANSVALRLDVRTAAGETALDRCGSLAARRLLKPKTTLGYNVLR